MLVAITCVHIASKFTEKRPVSLTEVESTLGQYQYTKGQIMKMDSDIRLKLRNYPN